MEAPALELDAPLEAIAGSAWRGRLTLAGKMRSVMVVLGAENPSEGSLDRARSECGPALVYRGPRVLPLLLVLQHEGRVAWVYDPVEGASLSWFVGGGHVSQVPLVVALSIAAQLAEALDAARKGELYHSGPEPSAVLIDRAGRVLLYDFVGPVPVSPAYLAPGATSEDRSEREAAQVFRLGVLLAQLLSGVSVGQPPGEEGHPAYLRRVAVRVLERAELNVSDRFIEWLQCMLAFDGAARPPLSTVAQTLWRFVGDDHEQVLRRWAQENVDRAQQGIDPPDTHEVTSPGFRPADLGLREDESTESIQPEVTESFRSTAPHPAINASSGHSGSIPVSVGPPSEAVPKPVKLPPGFLVADITVSSPADGGDGFGSDHTMPDAMHVSLTEEVVIATPWATLPWWALLAWFLITGGLGAAALGLGLFLLYW